LGKAAIAAEEQARKLFQVSGFKFQAYVEPRYDLKPET
jgi:predicted deacetylase